MNELALFAGAGGGLLASRLLGFNTVCAVECDPYAQSVLLARQNDGSLHPFPVWDDITTFDGERWRGYVDLVSGGFPCQPFSTAASGRNIKEKDLWSEMRRVIGEVDPSCVFAENVSRDAINQASDDLETMGYQTISIPLSAADLGADHIRERYWLFAYAHHQGELLRNLHAKMAQCSELRQSVWETFAHDSRMDDGVANRVDRYRTTGNGQIPIVAATAFKFLVELQYKSLIQKET